MTYEKAADIITHAALKAIGNPEPPQIVQNVVQAFEDYYTPSRVDVQYQVSSYGEFIYNLENTDISALESYMTLPMDLRNPMRGHNLEIALHNLPNDMEAAAQCWLDSVLDDYVRTKSENKFAIIVWFPTATITNEQDKSVEIYDLYAKIIVDELGHYRSGPFYRRATYPMYQFKQGYLHSHSPQFSTGDDFKVEWESVCTGTGPINRTKDTLWHNSDPMIWGAFCWELDKIVHIESIKGVPYYKMSNLVHTDGAAVKMYHINVKHWIDDSRFGSFIKYFLSKKCLKFSYHNGSYHLGESMNKFILDVSNAYIEWFNMGVLSGDIPKDQLESTKSYAQEFIVKDNQLYMKQEFDGDTRYTQHIGKPVVLFKNKIITLRILDRSISDDTINKVHILNLEMASQILYSILRVVNYNYAEKTNRESESEGTGTLQSGRQLLFR